MLKKNKEKQTSMVLSKHGAHVLMLAPTSTAFLTYAVSFPIHTPARARDHLCYYC